jgi:poly-beta-1,6-N-acetyl-D-glucosamine biosynthesis protein PgaD
VHINSSKKIKGFKTMETLIINKRHELPRFKRFIWDAATIVLWLCFLYLWKPLLLVFYRIITLKEPVEDISDWIFENVSSVPFEHALMMLIMTPALLFVLSRLNRRKAPSEHLLYESEDYAEYFGLDHTQLKEFSNSQLVTVYHNEHGHITHLANQIEIR